MSDQESHLEISEKEIEFSDRYQPLFDLLECWDELHRLSVKGLNRRKLGRYRQLKKSLQSEDNSDHHVELYNIRRIGLTPEEIEDLEYWELLSTVDTVLISGGRDSGKSFALSLFNALACADFGHRILYTRQTMSSTDSSIKSAINERLELLEIDNEFEFANNNFNHNSSGGKITITGQKTSSGTQTAKLKSLENFSIFETDEAEELESYKDWKKIKRSLRAKDVQCLAIMCFNPPTRQHFIYKEFYAGIPEGFNGIKKGVMYIHTNYLDNGKENMAEHNWNEYESKRKDYEYYCSLSEEDQKTVEKSIIKNYRSYKYEILGGFKENAEGVIFNNWKTGEFDESLPSIYGMDFGSTDPTTLVKFAINKKKKKIYVKELLYKTGMSTSEIISVISSHLSKTDLLVCDYAEPLTIKEIKKQGFNAKECVKGPDSIKNGIKALLDYEIIIDPDSENAIIEFQEYCWNDKKSDTPIDDYNHIIDAIRYCLQQITTKKKFYVK